MTATLNDVTKREPVERSAAVELTRAASRKDLTGIDGGNPHLIDDS